MRIPVSKSLKMLVVILLGLVFFVLFIASAGSGGWKPSLFTLMLAALPVYCIRAILGFTKRPLEGSEWKANIVISVVLILASAWGTASAIREADLPARKLPTLDELEVSRGILKEGFGGNRYLKRAGQPDLRLICADYVPGKGSGPDNSCLYPSEGPFIGKEVTVYHLPARKVVNWIATYFAMFSGGQQIVSYNTIISHLRYADQRRQTGYGQGAALSLGVIGVYFLIEGFIRRRRTTPSHMSTD